MKRLQKPFSVALINDDLIINKKSIKTMINVLKRFDRLSGISGVLRHPDGKLNTYSFLLGLDTLVDYSEVFGISPGFPTWLTGALSIYKFEHLERCG